MIRKDTKRNKELIVDSCSNDDPYLPPKRLRNNYNLEAIIKETLLNILQKMETTAISANAVGEEQHNIASRMWN